ncbi:hypothetical protein C8R44DRAFT_741924 [Mycena epipterygia]|nr:hypothetical protein C8R44DRAFT_741924 [Mycena epipterygia]
MTVKLCNRICTKLYSVVGTLGSGLTWSGGIFVNPVIVHIKSVKLITFTGTAIMSLGLFLASYCSSLWQLFLTPGLPYGIGSSLYYFPICASHRRILIATVASRWGASFLNFAVGVPIACVIRRRSRFNPTANGARTRINMGLTKRRTFLYQAFLSSLSVFAHWYDTGRECFIAFVVMYGIYSGGYNALIPTTITEIYGVESYSRVTGFVYFVHGLGSLLGTSIAGLILVGHKRGGDAPIEPADQLRARYEHIVVYDGLLLFGAGMCVAYVRCLDARDKGG